MKFKQTQSKARELLWLTIAAMSFATGIHKTVFFSFQESWYFFVFVLVAIFMFFIWRNKRISGQ